MIHDSDADFHTPTSDDPTWAETNYFGFYVPEANLNVGVYALFRANVGVVISTVALNSRFVTAPWQADYWDPQHHLRIPQPANLQDYSLANGLSVRCLDPNRVWEVSFDNGEDISLSFRFTALTVPFDIHDPDQDPIVAATLAASQEDSTFAWGEAYAGHFDLSGTVKGQVTLRGKTYDVDCVSTMDHSWGLRAEHQDHPMSWLHAHFSEDYAIHGIFDFDPSGGPDAPTELTLTHGYVVDGGELYGIAEAKGRTIREGYYAKSVELELTDSRGRKHRLTGLGRTSFPWQAGPGTVGFNVLAEWRHSADPEARGWGEIQDFLGPQNLCRIYSAAAERA